MWRIAILCLFAIVTAISAVEPPCKAFDASNCTVNCTVQDEKGCKLCACKGDVILKKRRPADVKPCEAGLRDDGTSCWRDSYGRTAGRAPDKSKCPNGLRDDGVSCWNDSYGRGVGRAPDKASCPAGLRDDGTSCWSDAQINGKGCCCTVFGCCNNCPAGFNDDGCTCRKVDVGIKVTLMQRQSCRNDEELNGLLCYPKCKPGYHAIGCCLCEPDGGSGIKVKPEQRLSCRDGEELHGLLCYPKCREGYRAAGCCLCEPNEGPGIKKTLHERQYCKTEESLFEGVCWEKCPNGFVEDGGNCKKV